MLGKTPWIDKIMYDVWDDVYNLAPEPDWVPQLIPGEDFSVEEYGCGYFGCVMPTRDPRVVIKVTSDESEAVFARGAQERNLWPDGIVRYYKIVNLKAHTRYRRPVYIMWREAVEIVGLHSYRKQLVDPKDQYKIKLIYDMQRNLNVWVYLGRHIGRLFKNQSPRALMQKAMKFTQEAWEIASELRGDSAWSHRFESFRGAKRVAVALALCDILSEEMANTDLQYTVGQALQEYLAEGILIIDVHENNIGWLRREDWPNGLLVITDPGLTVSLTDAWRTISVPQI